MLTLIHKYETLDLDDLTMIEVYRSKSTNAKWRIKVESYKESVYLTTLEYYAQEGWRVIRRWDELSSDFTPRITDAFSRARDLMSLWTGEDLVA